jgi:hypothetical protein
MPLSRIAWLVTVGVCIVTSLILLLSEYYGYAGVVFAVALSALINVW